MSFWLIAQCAFSKPRIPGSRISALGWRATTASSFTVANDRARVFIDRELVEPATPKTDAISGTTSIQQEAALPHPSHNRSKGSSSCRRFEWSSLKDCRHLNPSQRDTVAVEALPWLEKEAAERRTFGIHNRGQAHGWNFSTETGGKRRSGSPSSSHRR